MIPLYILDACALIAFLRKETGWEQVKDISELSPGVVLHESWWLQ